MPEKHAFLILFHHKISLLEKELSLLDHERCAFFLHCDKKFPLTPEEEARVRGAVKKGVLAFAPSVAVHWGGFSQIEAELSLFRAALSSGEIFSHLHLLSGVDLPIKPVGEILSFFDAHPGKEFVHFSKIDLKGSLRERFSLYHFFQEKRGRGDSFFAAPEYLSLAVQRLFRVDRVKKEKRVFASGANWCSITPSFAAYLLESKAEIRRLFSRSLCCDEVFLQTLLLSSPFEKNLFRPASFGDDAESCVRLIDWKRGDPYTFRDGDESILAASPCLFARKFDDETDLEVVNAVMKMASGPEKD